MRSSRPPNRLRLVTSRVPRTPPAPPGPTRPAGCLLVSYRPLAQLCGRQVWSLRSRSPAVLVVLGRWLCARLDARHCSGSQGLAKEAEEPIQVKGENDACKLADHEERRGAGSLCPRSLAQLTDIPFFNMDEETSDATIQSESPSNSRRTRVRIELGSYLLPSCSRRPPGCPSPRLRGIL